MNKNILLTTVFTLTTAHLAIAEDKTVATVNGKPVFESEISRNIDSIPNYDQLPEEQQELIREKIVQAITKLDAVVQEAKRLKVEDTEAYKNKLEDFKQQLMYSTLLENHIDNVVTDKKLKDYYNENKKDFIENKAKASHILVATKAEADEIIQKLTAGSDFAELAEEFSTGPSAKDGGNLGWFDEDAMVPGFSKAVFDLNAGEFTKKPVKTQFGWHVIMLDEKVEDTPALFEDVKEKIKEVVMQEEVENYLNNIIEKSDIVIND